MENPDSVKAFSLMAAPRAKPKLRWQLPTHSAEEFSGLPADWPSSLAPALLTRGISSAEKLRLFMDPPHRLPHSPLRLAGMEKALQRLHATINGSGSFNPGGEKVGVVGDFDLDGITGAAILIEGLGGFGVSTIPYLPHRVSEGHGLSVQAVNLLCEEGVGLIITVDCGISSAAEANLAEQRGMNVIITDHHTPTADLPKATAIINPQVLGNKYPFPQLCGAGLAFKLMQGLYQWFGQPWPRRLLELAALGSIADLVPLQDENRYLVREGLSELASTQRPGLQAMYQLAGIEPQDISAETVSFQIAPRLNASGRMGHAQDSLQLLTTDCPDEATRLAERLERLNRQRQELTRQAYAAAQAQIASLDTLPPILLVSDPCLTPGVTGLVAGQLARAYHRPAIALAAVGEDQLMASGRSIPQFNLIEVLDSCADLFLRHGGHPQAGGFTILKGNMPLLERRLEAVAAERLAKVDLQRVLSIDSEIRLSDLTTDFLARLASLEPFGVDNPKPIFLTRGLRVVEALRIGNRKQHLKLRLDQGQGQITALAFYRVEEWSDKVRSVDLVYSINQDYWRGVKRVKLLVEDFRPVDLR